MDTIWDAPISTWTNFHSLYSDALAVKHVANNSKNSKHSLPDLDKFVWTDLPATINGRNQPHLDAGEYMKVIFWKTQRGQSRPTLIGYAKQLTNAEIVHASTEAFKVLNDPRASIESFTALRGCGPATASAVLGALDHSYPYMSDELLMTVIGKRLYTPHVYFKLHKAVSEKVEQLVKDANEAKSDSVGPSIKWTAREVERAVFAHAMIPNKASASSAGASAALKVAEENKDDGKSLTPTSRARTRKSSAGGTVGGEDEALPTAGNTGDDDGEEEFALDAEESAMAVEHDDEEEVAAAEPKRRGRGRPPKVKLDGVVANKVDATSPGVKRGRGRPRKSPEAKLASSEPLPGRKRGRPRKNPENIDSKDDDETSGTVQKRGRGRPRKNAVSGEAQVSVATTGSGVRRGRGRPRKNPIVEEGNEKQQAESGGAQAE